MPTLIHHVYPAIRHVQIAMEQLLIVLLVLSIISSRHLQHASLVGHTNTDQEDQLFVIHVFHLVRHAQGPHLLVSVV